MSAKSIPSHLLNNPSWKAMFYLFEKSDKLRTLFNQKYFDLENEEVDFKGLKKKSQHWATSEKVLLNLALHLFNDTNRFKLSDLDALDYKNMKLAFEAMNIRFKCN